MKENKKLGIIIIAIVVIIIIAITAFAIIWKKDDSKEITENNAGQAEIQKGEFYKQNEDGSKENTSPKVAEKKDYDGLEIVNTKIVERNNVSKMTADVKNNSETTLGGHQINILLLDKSGNTIGTIPGYIDKVKPGETVQINASTSDDFANVYDYKIEKNNS